MKPKNFPQKKMIRKINAIKMQEKRMHDPYTPDELALINSARDIRTKKNRKSNSKF